MIYICFMLILCTGVPQGLVLGTTYIRFLGKVLPFHFQFILDGFSSLALSSECMLIYICYVLFVILVSYF